MNDWLGPLMFGVVMALIFAGFLGGGLLLYRGWLAGAPVMAVGDELFAAEAAGEGGHG